MRLRRERGRGIRGAAQVRVSSAAEVYPFGSRLDDAKRRSESGLYVETAAAEADNLAKAQLALMAGPRRRRGERKTNLVETPRAMAAQLPIAQEVKARGIGCERGDGGAVACDDEPRVLDQFKCRYTKLQDALGRNVFRHPLEIAHEPLRSGESYVDVLNIVARLGIAQSVQK